MCKDSVGQGTPRPTLDRNQESEQIIVNMKESRIDSCTEEDIQVPLQCAVPSEEGLEGNDSVGQGTPKPTLCNSQELENDLAVSEMQIY